MKYLVRFNEMLNSDKKYVLIYNWIDTEREINGEYPCANEVAITKLTIDEIKAKVINNDYGESIDDYAIIDGDIIKDIGEKVSDYKEIYKFPEKIYTFVYITEEYYTEILSASEIMKKIKNLRIELDSFAIIEGEYIKDFEEEEIW